MPVSQILIDGGYEEVIIFENPSYDSAFLGVSHDNRAIYDYEKMVECLMKDDDMSEEDAREFIDYNTLRSLPYQPMSPIILYPVANFGEEEGIHAPDNT